MLLIADEVQSGFARTGRFFAMEHYDVEADILTVAKSIGGGLPLSGVVGRAEVMDAPAPGGLGGTYAGNPVACAAACAVIDVIREEGIVPRAQAMGERFRAQVGALAADPANGIGEIRGLGAMVAFEFVKPGTHEPDAERTKAVTTRAAELGLVLLSCGVYYNTIRVLVPITASDAIFEEGLAILARTIAETRG
jgi:4-aminobutyrate aminotransferase/4-aminobutyrate aminotransferase/(S)-3-amino-2-methylpropionate transaminase